MTYIPDPSKTELDKARRDVAAKALKWRKCLTCQLNGIGRFDESAARQAESDFRDGVEDALAILERTVPPLGLLAGGE